MAGGRVPFAGSHEATDTKCEEKEGGCTREVVAEARGHLFEVPLKPTKHGARFRPYLKLLHL
jgi:hypothetical protein